ncbi:hypothetical protein L6452_18041 [Arctium lappa]|uniref:Uncharacterized protein n=1 Tax=Arctium lappa TaxID=4217 RepID=A0ACB9C588_ARCLA|nr:hypothetical protein L6452_18041 [Arctium lappa]
MARLTPTFTRITSFSSGSGIQRIRLLKLPSHLVPSQTSHAICNFRMKWEQVRGLNRLKRPARVPGRDIRSFDEGTEWCRNDTLVTGGCIFDMGNCLMKCDICLISVSVRSSKFSYWKSCNSSSKPSDIVTLCERLLSSYNEPFDLQRRVLSSTSGSDQEHIRTFDGKRQRVDSVCQILEGGPWGMSLENALSTCNESAQTDTVIAVLQKLKDVNLAVDYFRWSERKSNQAHCPEAYNSLLMVMARNKKFDQIEQVLEEMNLAGFGPSNSTCVELVVSCVKSHKLREAYDLIQLIRRFKFRPAFSAYTTLIGALSTAHEPDLILALFHQMQELGYEVNVHLFTTVIRVCAREGRIDAALSMLDEMRSNSVDGVLCKANKLNEAIELFEQMEHNKKVPCAYAYNTMIMGYGLAGKFDEAFQLLGKQKLKGSIPSVIAYNCILTYNLCKSQKLDTALKIQGSMKEAGLYPNIISVNIMIDRLCKSQQLDEALLIFENIDPKICPPTDYTYCSLIEGLGRHNRVDDAYRLYERMLESGMIPNVVVYTSLIRSFFMLGRKEDGHKMYKEMVRGGVSPDLTLLNTYMDCVFKAGEMDKGRALFEEIKATGYVPDTRSYSILIHGLVKAGFAQETHGLFYAMKEQGCVLDTVAYNSVIDGFCKSGLVNKAYQLLEEMKVKGHSPTVVTYGSVIDGLAKINRLDEAYMLFEEAKSKGVELNVVVYSSLVDGFGKVGRIEEAYLIIEELMQKGLTPNVYTWNCLLDALVKAEEINEALICIDSMKDLKCIPNAVTYSIIINGLCRVRKFNKAYVFWQEMQKQGLQPNVITYTTMICGLARAGNILEANRLFEKKSGGSKGDG